MSSHLLILLRRALGLRADAKQEEVCKVLCNIEEMRLPSALLLYRSELNAVHSPSDSSADDLEAIEGLLNRRANQHYTSCRKSLETRVVKLRKHIALWGITWGLATALCAIVLFIFFAVSGSDGQPTTTETGSLFASWMRERELERLFFQLDETMKRRQEKNAIGSFNEAYHRKKKTRPERFRDYLYGYDRSLKRRSLTDNRNFDTLEEPAPHTIMIHAQEEKSRIPVRSNTDKEPIVAESSWFTCNEAPIMCESQSTVNQPGEIRPQINVLGQVASVLYWQNQCLQIAHIAEEHQIHALEKQENAIGAIFRVTAQCYERMLCYDQSEYYYEKAFCNGNQSLHVVSGLVENAAKIARMGNKGDVDQSIGETAGQRAQQRAKCLAEMARSNQKYGNDPKNIIRVIELMASAAVGLIISSGEYKTAQELLLDALDIAESWAPSNSDEEQSKNISIKNILYNLLETCAINRTELSIFERCWSGLAALPDIDQWEEINMLGYRLLYLLRTDRMTEARGTAATLAARYEAMHEVGIASTGWEFGSSRLSIKEDHLRNGRESDRYALLLLDILEQRKSKEAIDKLRKIEHWLSIQNT